MLVIKGKRAVLEAINAATPPHKVVVSFAVKDSFEHQNIMRQAKQKQVPIEIIAKEEFEKLAIAKPHQGIIAYVKQKIATLSDIILQIKHYPIIVAVDHIQDPYNFGAIIRSCEIFGIKAIIYPKDRNCKITPGVIKASSGALHHLQLIQVTNLAQALAKLKDKGYWLYGANANQGEALNKLEPLQPCIIVFGNEKSGLSNRIQKMLDVNILIPQKGKTDSLNVSVAAGIITYIFSIKLLK
jgi:23S rRNA (guanosine2251-2'-O)-methyltransferase